MKKEDYKKGLEYCSGCGEKATVICKCEVGEFKDEEQE